MHRKVLGVAAVLLAALALLPCEADAQKNKNNKNNQKQTAVQATDQDYYLIQNQKALVGQVLGFDDASHSLQVRIDFPEWVKNPKYRPNAGAQHQLTRDYNRLMQEQSRAMASRNPQQMMQHYNRMMSFQARVPMDMARAGNGNGQAPFVSKDHLKDFDFDLQDNIVYRKMFLPQEYDDTGNLKQYSPEERTKLRGNNKPKDSYAATSTEFHPGQGVWIYLTAPNKYKSSSSSSSSASSAKKEKEEDDNVLKSTSVPRPTVKMLVIFREGTVAPTTNKKGNPKKKKN